MSQWRKIKIKRLILLLDSQEQLHELRDFNRGLAMETIDRELSVVLFWSECASRALRERIYKRLQENLTSFGHQEFG